MDLIRFTDSCIIKRNLGGIDEYDVPIQEVVYEGRCLYLESNIINSQQMLISNPILFILQASKDIKPNDVVEIVTKHGDSVNAIVGSSRNVDLSNSNQHITRLGLRQVLK